MVYGLYVWIMDYWSYKSEKWNAKISGQVKEHIHVSRNEGIHEGPQRQRDTHAKFELNRT